MISFVSEDRQLCFKCVLVDPLEKLQPLVLYQRFVFHLSWASEEFKENETVPEDLFESGELELFDGSGKPKLNQHGTSARRR